MARLKASQQVAAPDPCQLLVVADASPDVVRAYLALFLDGAATEEMIFDGFGGRALQWTFDREEEQRKKGEVADGGVATVVDESQEVSADATKEPDEACPAGRTCARMVWPVDSSSYGWKLAGDLVILLTVRYSG